MIDPRELRIGNYFVWDSFASMGNGIDRIESGQQIDDYIDFKNPITITHEWLKKFGFYEDEPHLIIPINEPVTRELMFNQYSKMFSIFNSGNHLYLGSIKYVHRLQNLYFALTGKELEIKP